VSSGARLVGRAPELQLAERAIAEVLAGRPAGLTLFGGPGVGKSALLAALCQRAELAGMRTFQARALESEHDVVNGLLKHVFEQPISTRDGRNTRDSAADALGWLDSADRALLALDDVQWADEASLAALARLLHRGLVRPALLVIALRPTAPRPLIEAAEAAARAGWLTRAEIAPLLVAEAEQLMGDLAPEARRALYGDSGGNPFYLTELIDAERARQTRGAWPERSSEVQRVAVPPAVARAIVTELNRLSPRAGSFARAAAVAGVGESFDAALAAQVAGVDDDTALDAVEEMIQAGMVLATDVPWRFAFRYPVACRAIYESTSASFRLAAHARAAAAMRDADMPLSMQAHHVERCARVGDDQSIELLMRAAQLDERQAPDRAVRWLQAALRLVPASADTQRRVQMRIALASAQRKAGLVPDSRATLTDALDLVGADDGRRRELVAAIAKLGHMEGRHGDAHELPSEMLALADEEASAARVGLGLELAAEYCLAGDSERMLAVAAAVREDAGRLGDVLSQAAACGYEAVARFANGDAAAAGRLSDRAAEMIESLPHTSLVERVEALLIVVYAEQTLERHDRAVSHLDLGMTLAQRYGYGLQADVMSSMLVGAYLRQGRLQDAEDTIEAALAAADHLNVQSYALPLRAWIRTLRGNLDGAHADANGATAMLTRAQSTILTVPARNWLAAALLELDRPEHAWQELAAHVTELTPTTCATHPEIYQTLTICELALGNVDAAERWAVEAEAAAANTGLGGRIGVSAAARARLELARGHALRAAESALAGARSFATAGWRLDAGRCELLAGKALVAARDRGRAIEVLRHAHAELDACGAVRYRDQATRELRRIGTRAPRRVLRTGPSQVRKPSLDSLTPREREVALLVARGITNREIAAQLFVSTKTVESHVSSAFQKLGVGSRVSLAMAVRAELEAAPAVGGGQPGDEIAGTPA
jgi:DNA-binding CsgD family transcriptional regulator